MSKPTSLAGRAFWVARHRPGHFFQYLRAYWLFSRTRWLLKILRRPGLELGRNVRVERLRCLKAETPDARIRVGDHSLVFEGARLEAFGRGCIEIGQDTVLSDLRIYSRGSVRIGSQCLLSWGVYMQDFDPHPIDSRERARQVEAQCRGYRPSWAARSDAVLPYESEHRSSPILIGDRVWVGAQAIILKGARIGSGCIVAAGAVVTAGDYPPESLIAGNPARVVKSLAASID